MRQRLSFSVAINAYRVLVALGVLGAWQLLAAREILNPLLFSSSVEVVRRLVELLGGEAVFGRSIYSHVLATLEEMAIG
jgi:ABC-type nitrate/sulfonate/bicarbonate transport system permease component